MKNQEIELKYYLAGLPAYLARLEEVGARLIQPRTHERNLRFDTLDGELSRSYKVLRLRQDQDARLTYKGPGQVEGGVRVRQEIEFTVGDFQTAQAFLVALGYQVIFLYEKYRSTYDLGGVLVTVDEMPFGNFTELEGDSPEAVQQIGARLSLSWDHRILDSYTLLFDRLKSEKDLPFRDLSFENFAGLEISPQDLHVHPADV